MAESQPGPTPLAGRARLLAQYPWLTFLLPLVVFLVVTSLEPKPPTPAAPAFADARDPLDPDALAADEVKPQGEPDKNETQTDATWFGVSIPYRAYPIVYSIKLALVAATMLFVLPGYRQWAFLSGLGCVTYSSNKSCCRRSAWACLSIPDSGARSIHWSSWPAIRRPHMAFWRFGSLAWC
jgi:hypothetical protein